MQDGPSPLGASFRDAGPRDAPVSWSCRNRRWTSVGRSTVKVFVVVVLLAFCASSIAGTARGLSAAPLVVPCRDITAGTAPAPGQAGTQSALGVIAVAAPAYEPHPAVPVQNAGRWTYWRRQGWAYVLGSSRSP